MQLIILQFSRLLDTARKLRNNELPSAKYKLLDRLVNMQTLINLFNLYWKALLFNVVF